MATIYFANGQIEEVDGIGKNKVVPLEQAQGVVKGYIECVDIPGRKVLIANENGIAEGLPLNPNASKLAGTEIVGDVLVVQPKRSKWY